MKLLSKELTKGYLAYLEHFSLSAGNKKVNQNALSGQRKSGVRGSSLEFSDFREYNMGDDIRRIDWNSFARGDKLYTKTYLEEKQLSWNLFLDTSQSFGLDEEKGFLAKLICASVAYVALKNNDKVNIYCFGGGVKDIRVNNISKNAFANIIAFLDTVEFGGESRLEQAVREAMPKTQRGITLVISDMFFQDDMGNALKALSYKKQNVTIVQVLSAEEAEPRLEGSFRLTDCETGSFKDVTVTESLLADYKRALMNMQSALHESCKRSGGKFVKTTAAVTAIEETMKDIFG